MKKRLIIINNIKEYEQLVKDGYNFTGLTIVTTNIDLYFRYKEKIEIINLWKYLDENIVTFAENESVSIHDNWRLENNYSIKYDGVDIFEITKVLLKPFFKGAYHTLKSLEKLNQEYVIDEVYINEDISKSMQVFFDNNHVLNAISKDFFIKRGISVKNYEIEFVELRNDMKSYNFDTSQYPFNFERLERSKNAEKVLILLSENFEWDYDLAKYLQKKYDNVFVILRTPSRSAADSSIINQPLFFNDFFFQTGDFKNDVKKIDEAKNHFLVNKSNKPINYPELFSNEYLNFQYEDFFEREKTYLRDLHTFENMYKFIRPDKIYFSNSWDLGVRCMAKFAMDKGSKTYLTIHGGVVDNSGYKGRTFNTSNYLVWGKDNSNGLINAGQDEVSIQITGSMQMEYWNEKVNEYNEKGKIDIKSEYDNIYNLKLKREKIQIKPVITFFTSSGGGFASHNMNEYKHIDSLKKIIEYARKREDLEFRIKPHVLFDYYEFWENMKNEIPDNLKIIKENNLLQACDEMDLGILFNVISNVAYEISLMCKPLIYLKDAVFNTECGESTTERGGILCLNTFEELEELLEKYFEGEEITELKADIENRRKQFLEFSLADFSKPVLERIEELLMKKEYKNGAIVKTETDENVYKIIKWVSSVISNERIERFPGDIDCSKLPHGEDFIHWIYNLTDNWCRYFKKEEGTDKYFNLLITELPKEVGVDRSLKIKRKVYSKTRAMYLKYGLNENEKFRKIVKKIIN
ncbi:MAG: hypothetical protein NTY74_11215 [Ignavibacteriae bacterium]|nr:hypothetical protein [Ignavibacteriota bacterium]